MMHTRGPPSAARRYTRCARFVRCAPNPRHLVIYPPRSFETMHGEAPLLPIPVSLYLCTPLHPSSPCHMVNPGALPLVDIGCIRGALVWLAVRLWGSSNAQLVSGAWRPLQVHQFIFYMAITHILGGILLIVLASLRIRFWKRWTEQADRISQE